MEEKKWKIFMDFKGVWYSPDFGGFSPDNRLRQKLPRDVLADNMNSEEQQKYRKEHNLSQRFHEQHDSAKPTWITKKEVEKQYGEVKTVIYKEPGKEREMSYSDVLIFTEDFIVSISEYDGAEGLHATPRNPEVYFRKKLNNT